MALLNPFKNADTAANYEAWYHTTGKKAADQEKLLIKTLLSSYVNAQTILEVGCGTGYFTDWVKTLGKKPVGLDCSRPMIQVAQKTHHLVCLQGEAHALPFPLQSFDLVMMITSLEFFSDPIQALSEGLRIARQGLILGVINKHSLLGRRYRKKGGPIWSAAKLYTPRELIRMLSELTSERDEIKFRTTLLPCYSGSSKLSWGGFIGMSVKLSSQRSS